MAEGFASADPSVSMYAAGGQEGTATPTLRRKGTGSTRVGLGGWVAGVYFQVQVGPEEWPEVPTTPTG